jgi:hypothetical protein
MYRTEKLLLLEFQNLKYSLFALKTYSQDISQLNLFVQVICTSLFKVNKITEQVFRILIFLFDSLTFMFVNS